MTGTDTLMDRQADAAARTASAPLAGARTENLAVSLTSDLAAVESVWRRLEAGGLNSPGQAFDFIRTWVETLGIRRKEQVYATVTVGARPVMLVPLALFRRFGARVLGWMPGSHVGCNAPLIDRDYFKTLDDDERAELWRRVLAALPPADAVMLRAVPETDADLFGGTGKVAASEALYIAEFSSWQECEASQHDRKRRKRDRQQGAKLDALGEISFGPAEPHEYDAVLKAMFAQKSGRFGDLGIVDPFACPKKKAFYRRVLDTGTFKPLVYVLRVDGEIASVRYCLGAGDKLFALISSMSENPRLQGGSPGKQGILRIVKSVFDEGYRVLDIGVGESDEKRAWCNVQLPVANHYFPRTPVGYVFMWAQKAFDFAKRKIKSDRRLFDLYIKARPALTLLAGRR